MNEIDIIKGCLKNDRVCQKTLYENFYSNMLGIYLRYSQSTEEAKKMLQEGFVQVLQLLKNYNHKSSFEEWLKKTIVQTAIDYLRKNKQHYLIVSTVNAHDKPSEKIKEMSDEELELKIHRDEILQAIQQLTPAYRTVYNLFVIENYTHKQIAELLDISEETSQSNLAKAKFNLRKNILLSLKLVNDK